MYGSFSTPQGDWFHTFAGRTARVSPGGQYLAFVSERPLTGYDNSDTSRPGQLAYEIFLYDAVSGSLGCASCNADGSRPNKESLLPPPSNGIYQQRYLNDAGELFFSTEDRVAPADTNNTSDVYEYSDGRARLLSPGDTEDEAVFADASENGGDAFFTTRQRLVGSDKDSIVDLYDARVSGGIEAQNELPSVPCLDEGCKPSATEQLVSALPGSGTFIGPENPPALFHQKKIAKRAGKVRHKKKRRKKIKKKSGRKSNTKRSVKHGRGGAK
jgi:hypothetical protein